MSVLTTIHENMPMILTVTDIVGTMAFAVSGAMVAIRKKMDIFGVNILALVTATGGGIIRDVLVGMAPPACFRNRRDIYIAIIMANIVFLFLYFHRKRSREEFEKLYVFLYFWFDTLGLAAFTVNGVAVGYNYPFYSSGYFIVFLGVLTGVGGGVLRDVMAMEMPAIFVRHIYACASMLGAIVSVLLWSHFPKHISMLAGFLVVLVIRSLASHYHWNLPKIQSSQYLEM